MILDYIQQGIIKTHRTAQEFAEDLVDRWHNDQFSGRLQDVLGLSAREYQAWTTGGVSLLTIARWRQKGHPPLDVSRPWFKLAGRPPLERVGYLEQKRAPTKKKRRIIRIHDSSRRTSKRRR